LTSVTDVCNRSCRRLELEQPLPMLRLQLVRQMKRFSLTCVMQKLEINSFEWHLGIVRSRRQSGLYHIRSSTPENTSAAQNLWMPGIPAPPYAYEYQYPVDCLRMCWLIPANQTGYASGVPITTAVTGGASTLWTGKPIKYKVQNDQFLPVVRSGS